MRFTIRDVLWLTAVVAFGICWYRDHQTARNLGVEVSGLKGAVAMQKKDIFDKAVEIGKLEAANKRAITQRTKTIIVTSQEEADRLIEEQAKLLKQPPIKNRGMPNPVSSKSN